MTKRVCILGSTGSIGRSALDVIESMPDQLGVHSLSAHSRWELLASQAERFVPRDVALIDGPAGGLLRERLGRTQPSIRVHTEPEGLLTLVQDAGCDFVLMAVVGAAGLPPVMAAVERGLPVGIANKEPLVAAGSLLMPLALRTGAALIPVDSEHSAVFQAMQSGRRDEVSRIFLTASGGPFRTWTQRQMEDATLEDALRHPTWTMGPKITVDSATMMNKALEIVEARWLFDLRPEQIEVVIHPESIVHSMVEFTDGSIMAQMGPPDMRTPIQYALTYPARRPGRGARLDFGAVRALNFEPPDLERFPAIRLGYEVARRGGTAGAALNAANEAAVEAFRGGRIRYCEIVPRVRDVLDRHAFCAEPTLEQVLAVDAWARREVMNSC